MPKKRTHSKDPAKVRAWIEANKDIGQINGLSIVAEDPVELRGFVSESDYNEALKLSFPWGFKKAGIGEFGVAAIARSPILPVQDFLNIRTYREDEEESRLFRCKIKAGTLNILERKLSSVSLNHSQRATVVLKYFIADPAVQMEYAAFIEKTMAESGLSQKEIEDIIFACFRLDGAIKRLELLEAGDPEGESEKLP
jgi:hypothetical protein